MSYMNDDCDPFGIPYPDDDCDPDYVEIIEKEPILKDLKDLEDKINDLEVELDILKNDLKDMELELLAKMDKYIPVDSEIDFEDSYGCKIITDKFNFNDLEDLKKDMDLKDIKVRIIGFEEQKIEIRLIV